MADSEECQFGLIVILGEAPLRAELMICAGNLMRSSLW